MSWTRVRDRPSKSSTQSSQRAGLSIVDCGRRSSTPSARQLIIVTTNAAPHGLRKEDVIGCHVRIDEIPDTAIVADEIGLGTPRPPLPVQVDPRNQLSRKPAERVDLPDHDAAMHRPVRVQHGRHSVEEAEIGDLAISAQIILLSLRLDNKLNRFQPTKRASSSRRADQIDCGSNFIDCVTA